MSLRLLTLLMSLATAGHTPHLAPADSLSVRRGAEEAQARFERRRRRMVPRTMAGGGGGCDEVIGRMCLRLESSDDWWPEPEGAELTRAREELLALLAEAGSALPGDGWILGQRVVYLTEAGRADEARRLARGCGPEERWWCAALEGFALHVSNRIPEADSVFERALETMPVEERRRWLTPRAVADRMGREALDDASNGEFEELARRFWALADPLFLVEGNDRWTEHLARRVMARAREESQSPYALRWGDDLEELLVRYGWEVGWERVDPRPGQMSMMPHAVGHHHPESRAYTPPGEALTTPHLTRPEDWNPGSRFLPRSGFAPEYAPVILPVRPEVYRVPRADSLVVIALLDLPSDTSYHSRHEHGPLPRAEAYRGLPAAHGVFAVQDGVVVAEDRAGGRAGVVRVTLRPGDYLLSGEVWDSESGLAGRHREGVRWEAVPPDVATASDLLIAEPEGVGATSLDEFLEHLRTGELTAGERFTVAWELGGFGWRRETLEYSLVVLESPGGLLRRAGRFLGLVGRGRVFELDWAESGPDAPGPWFRTTEVTLPPGLDPGGYVIRLRVRAAGREGLTMERAVTISPASR